MDFKSALGALVSDPKRRRALMAVTAGYMLVQLSSLPVALSLPTIADYFSTGLDEAAWIIVVYLASLGSFVLLAARMGDRFGHNRIFFIGIIASTLSAILIATSNSLLQIIIWRALSGFGAALVLGNANAILAGVFPPDERGRAFSIPIMGARFGTLTGLGLFGLFLQFLSWRLVFLSFLPMGIIALAFSIPMLKQREERSADAGTRLDYIGGLLLVVTLAVLIMSGNHLHGGEESFISESGLIYHLPMNGLFLLLLAIFILVERSVKNPIVEINHFKQKYFSMALVSNTAYHFSMLATMTLVPILIERGFGKGPLWVTLVLVPSQVLGLFLPVVAGWIYDRYNPKLLRPGAMVAIAGGFLLLGIYAGQVSFWVIPLLMLPISIGTSIFNPINNAAVMNSLPTEHRGFSSGMLETTREMGHAVGATASAAALAFVLPVGISALSGDAAQQFYKQGFQISAMMVVLVLLGGSVIAYFHKTLKQQEEERAASSVSPAYQAGDD